MVIIFLDWLVTPVSGLVCLSVTECVQAQRIGWNIIFRLRVIRCLTMK